MKNSFFSFKMLLVPIVVAVIASFFLVTGYQGCPSIPLYSMVRMHLHPLLSLRLRWNVSGIEDLDPNYLSPLQIAVNQNCLTCADLLLKAGASSTVPISPAHKHGYFPVHLAATRGNWEMIQLLASAGASLEATDTYHCTPLFYAVRFRFEGLVEHLLKMGANPNHRSGCGWKPIHWAALQGMDSAVPALVRAGAVVKEPVRAQIVMEKFAIPRGQQIGVLKMSCWPDLQGTSPPSVFTIELFNWSNAPDRVLPAMSAEEQSPRLFTPLELSKLLGKDTITAYLQSHGG